MRVRQLTLPKLLGAREWDEDRMRPWIGNERRATQHECSLEFVERPAVLDHR